MDSERETIQKEKERISKELEQLRISKAESDHTWSEIRLAKQEVPIKKKELYINWYDLAVSNLLSGETSLGVGNVVLKPLKQQVLSKTNATLGNIHLTKLRSKVFGFKTTILNN